MATKAPAKVKLTGAKTFARSNGTKWRQGQEKTLTKQADVDYYDTQPSFSVRSLSEEEAEKVAATEPAPKATPKKEKKKGVFGRRRSSTDEEAPI